MNLRLELRTARFHRGQRLAVQPVGVIVVAGHLRARDTDARAAQPCCIQCARIVRDSLSGAGCRRVILRIGARERAEQDSSVGDGPRRMTPSS